MLGARSIAWLRALADIVIVDGDPLRDSRALLNVVNTIKEGRIFHVLGTGYSRPDALLRPSAPQGGNLAARV